jgi:hypothetical protein
VSGAGAIAMSVLGVALLILPFYHYGCKNGVDGTRRRSRSDS